MNHFVLSAQFRVFVAEGVETMGTGRNNFFDSVGIQGADVLGGLHLKEKFIAGTTGWIAGAGFFGAQDRKRQTCMLEDLGDGEGDFFGPVVKAARTAHPKKVFSALTAGLELGKGEDFHAKGGSGASAGVLFGPGQAVGGREGPGCAVVFDVTLHQRPFGGHFTGFHGLVATHFQDDVEGIDQNRASFDTGIAGGAGQDFFACYVVSQEVFAVFDLGGLRMRLEPTIAFFESIPGVHHDFARREFFARDVGRADRGAATALGAGIGVQQAFPGQVMHIGGAKSIGGVDGNDGRRGGVQHGLYFVLNDGHIGHGAGRFQRCVPCVGKSQNDVKMFGVGQVVEKGQYSAKVQPPGDTFGCMKGLRAPAIEKVGQPSADRKRVHPGMHGNVRCIHHQQRPHQNDFDDEDDLGIPSRPAG